MARWRRSGATSVFDYGEAGRLLQQALKVQDVLDPNDKAKRCDLLAALGRALARSLQQDHAVGVEFTQALSLADEIGDRRRAAMICVWATMAIAAKGMAAHGSTELLQWAEKADRYAEPDTIERGWADSMLGWVECVRGNQAEGVPLLRRAIESARDFGDRELLARAASHWTWFGQVPWFDAEEAVQVAEDLVAARNNIDSMWAGYGTLIMYGRRQKAEAVGRAIKQLAATTGEVHHISVSHLVDLFSALMDGRLEEIIELLEREVAWRQEVGLPADLGQGAFVGFRALQYLNGVEDNTDSIVRRAVLEGVNVPVFRRLPMLPAHLGQVDEVNQRLDRMLKARPDLTTRDDMTMAFMDVAHLEAAVLVKHRQAAGLLIQRFADNTLVMSGVCVARILGGAAAFLGRYDEARAHYREAIRACAEMRFRPELALSRLQLAELLLEHYPAERKDALEHLDFAIKEFREMKMRPSLERALRRKEILRA